MLLDDRNDINKLNICCTNSLLLECIPHNNAHWLIQVFNISSLNANSTEWLNTLKQFIGKKPTNCLTVFDDFVWLAHKWLVLLYKMTFPIIAKEQILFYVCPFRYSYGFTHLEPILASIPFYPSQKTSENSSWCFWKGVGRGRVKRGLWSGKVQTVFSVDGV